MKTWFEVKISYIQEEKKVNGSYLVDAMSFTEAEARIIEEMTPLIVGIKGIKIASYSDVFGVGDKWYSCKLEFMCIDEKSGKEKRTAINMLTSANDIDQAKTFLIEGMKGTLADYEVVAIKETNIIDVFVCVQ